MPSFRGDGGYYGATAEVTPDGKRLIVGNAVIDPYNKQQTELPAIGETPGVYTIYYSPDHRYRVINKIDSKYTPVTNEKNKSKDWVSIGSCNTDTSWHYKSYEDNYAVGVTDAGEVLTTKPSGFNTKYALKIEKMKGLWRYDPKTGTKTEISGDVLFDDDHFNKYTFTTQDRKKFIVYRTHKAELPEIIVYDIATGNKHTFNAPRYSFIVSVGNDIVLLKNVDNATQNAIGEKGGNEGVLLSLDDGHELLASEQAINAASSFADYKLPNCFISGNKFYFLHPTDFSVVRMELENGKMAIKSITKLDTSGLKLALYSDTLMKTEFKEGQAPKKSIEVVNGRSRYVLAVLKDMYVIFPETAPEKYKKPYPLFMYFMHPESGEAMLAMKPYFTQPVERNYAAEKAREDERKRMNDAECDRKAAVAPFHTGALLRKKSSTCKTPSFIWGGVNCETQQYVAFGITGSLRGYETISNPSELEVCDPGPYIICSYCRGAGSYKQWGTVADDGWKQTNFNVYVRNPNGVKAAQLDHICDVCKGKGYFRQ